MSDQDRLPLSKTLDPADFALLPKELAIVDRHFATAIPQHPMRRWEYALALWAIWHWKDGRDARYPRGIVDVGGNGSPFWRMAAPLTAWVQVIDPAENTTLETYLTSLASRPTLVDVVTCISVLEHVEDLDQFCYHLSCLVAPGGLLFLTMDYCDGFADARDAFRVPDTYHFHWMRKRIFNSFAVEQLIAGFYRQSFTLFGDADYTWHGPQVYDYTFASLALVKRA